MSNRPPFLTSVRDTVAVARFHLARALRTKSALALLAVHILVAGGGAWVTSRILLELEHAAADALHVPRTKKPGAMLEALRANGELASTWKGMVGEELVDRAMSLPALAVTFFWFGLGTLPFLAAMAGAETLSDAIRDRSLRYEVVRTGRLELLLGRFFGQATLLALGVLGSTVGPLLIAKLLMVQQDGVALVASLLDLSARLFMFSLPFLGLGVAASACFANAHVARTVAMGATVATWTFWGLYKAGELDRFLAVVEPILPVVPQASIVPLWEAGARWTDDGAILLGVGIACALLSAPRFLRRTL
jgi:ABC-type transport system involved in multi-copper enzyme maturation permease subunit